MKLLHKILGIGTLGLIITLPLISQTPVWAGFDQINQVIAQVSPQPTVQLNLSAAKKTIVVTTGDQKKIEWSSLDDGAVVNPGDILRYTVSSQNSGANAANNLTITQPIPEQMVYEIGTATSENQAEVVYSIDNGETFVAEPTITIKTEDGATMEKPAPPETYTHIRWKFGSLSSESNITAMYEVKVQ